MEQKTEFSKDLSFISFVVSDSTTQEVAKQMLEIIFKDWNMDETFTYTKKIHDNLSKLDEDESIVIPFSFNCDTLIFKDGGKVFVETSTSHDWSSLNILTTLPYSYVDEDMIFTDIEDNVKYVANQIYQREKIKEQKITSNETYNIIGFNVKVLVYETAVGNFVVGKCNDKNHEFKFQCHLQDFQKLSKLSSLLMPLIKEIK